MEIKLPDTAEISAGLSTIRDRSAAIVIQIASAEDYRASGDMLLDIKALHGKIDGTFDPLIALARELVDSIRLTKSSFSFPLNTLRSQIELQRREFEDRHADDKPAPDPELLESMGLPAFTGPPPLALPKTKGVGSRSGWRAEVTDIKALCRAVADDKAPEEYVLGNMPVLNKIAGTSKTLMAVPGVKAIEKKSTVVRSKKK